MTLLTKNRNKKSTPTLSNFFSDLWDQSPFWEGDQEILPSVNIKDKKDSYEIEVSAPGFDKEDLDISLEDHVLTISSEKEEESTQNEEHYTRKEFRRSSFSRSFNLPENVKEDDISAKYEKGILKVNVKKKEESVKGPSKKIEVS